MKRIIWLSCDLDLRGDYKSLYAWIDEKGKREKAAIPSPPCKMMP